MRYRDRVHAGRELACELAGRVHGDATVVAVSGSAAVVGRAVARSLGVPLQVLRPDDRRTHEVGPGPTGGTVVVVDDGMTTGADVVAVCDLLRESGAGRLVAAVPVAGVDAVGRVRSVADDVVVLNVQCEVGRVADWYEFASPDTGQQGADGGDPGPHGHGPAVLLRAG